MELAKVNPDLQIVLPPLIREWLGSETELAAFLQGDTLVLKKVSLPKLSSIAERAAGKEMALDEIAEEVHEYRKARKKQ